MVGTGAAVGAAVTVAEPEEGKPDSSRTVCSGNGQRDWHIMKYPAQLRAQQGGGQDGRFIGVAEEKIASQPFM